MVSILPVENENLLQEILQNGHIDLPEAVALRMEDSGKPMGDVILSIRDKTVKLWSLSAVGYSYDERPNAEYSFVLDGLLRAAVSYGEHNGATMVETAFPDFFDFFRTRGFTVDAFRVFGPVSCIISYK